LPWRPGGVGFLRMKAFRAFLAGFSLNRFTKQIFAGILVS
jgi:hypothetical protein